MHRIQSSTYHTMLMALFLMLYSLFNPDTVAFYLLLGLPKIKWAIEAGTEVFFIGIIVSTFHFLTFTYRPKGSRLSILPLLAVGILSIILYFVLAIWNYQLIAHIFFLSAAIGYYLFFQISCYKEKLDTTVFTLTSGVAFSAMGMHTTNVLYFSGITKNILAWSSGYLWIILFCFLSVYLGFILSADKQAQKAEELEKQVEQLKTNMLVEQFKPHFVSNALMIIKTTYHRDLDEGDRALWLFSNYMRDTVGMLKAGVVSFERELEFVMHYIDFCNVNGSHGFKVFFDIDCADFEVPALSLQPYIENAVKYSKINQKEDGCITISSFKEKDDVVLQIFDNGVGFDVREDKKGSNGINNSVERFSILLKAKTKIESDKNGTLITIRIPHAGGKE